MKLNPPETAPRNALVLGHFKGMTTMIPMTWDYVFACWVVPREKAQVYRDRSNDRGAVSFRNDDLHPDALIGWLPLPQIDDEGNVTWPTASPA